MCPVRPIQPSVGDLRRSGTEVGGDMVDPKDVLMGDQIVGTEHVTLDKHGPGAIEVDPMNVPTEMTPAQ